MASSSLQKFNQLPKTDRDFLSAAKFLSVIDELETKYNISLAMVFIELIVGDLALNNLASRFPNLDDDSIKNIGDQLSQLISDFKDKDKSAVVEATGAVTFSSADDEEIKKIISASDLVAKHDDYNSLAKLIITESGYDAGKDEVIANRLKNIIVARLKDIRDELETLEALKKSRKIGGMELADEQAKKIIALAKEKINQGLLKSEIDVNSDRKSILFPSKRPFTNGKISLETKKNNSLSKEPVVTPPKKLAENKVVRPDLNSAPTIEEEDGLPVIKSPMGDDLMIKPKVMGLGSEKKTLTTKSAQPLKTFPATAELPIPTIKPVEIKSEVPKPVVTPQSQIKPQPQPLLQSTPPPKNIRFGKPAVDGVRMSGLLVGPIEELSTMTLINFRRLGQTPHQATAKIQEKIELLEKDSFAKKIAGIEAWHRSEINRFYRLLGQESMRQERSIDDIINERLEANKPTLSIEEFNSVMELNRELRY